MASKRSHHKRPSLRLSNESNLPEYHPAWPDKPPEYSDGDDADEDTDPADDEDDDSQFIFLPTASTSPRRKAHRRKPSQLDSLLARSVHALEMSNTLLQSSISTQTSLTAILAHDPSADRMLEARAMDLSARIQNTWSAELDGLSRDVETLFSDSPFHSTVSCSLPTSSPPILRPSIRRPSLDLQEAAAQGKLTYSPQPRARLVSPPPRALTQYIDTQDADKLPLPPTLGVRKPLAELTASLAPKLTDRPLEPSTPAYNMLSSFVYRGSSSGTPTPSTSFKAPSFMRRRRGSSASGSTGTERRRPSRSPAQTPLRSPSPTPGPSTVIHRTMTPPTEESSSSSSEGPMAKQTVKSLRKILDDQPSKTPDSDRVSRSSSIAGRRRAPAFMPITPAPVAESGTSTATASISRLFTKGTHSSSTRGPSPPRHSALKRPGSTPAHSRTNSATASSAPSPSPSVLSIPGIVKALGVSTPSSSASGPSTPKRISFAELPESYAATKPPGPGGTSAFKEKQEEGRRKRAQKRRGGSSPTTEPSSLSQWWSGWLIGAAAGGGPGPLTAGLVRQQERMEDRASRNWGGRMGHGLGGGLDEWAV